MSRILVAGGTGFVGANTARHFADFGTRVVVTTRKKNDLVAASLKAYSDLITVEEVDLCRADQVYTLYDKYDFSGVVLLAQTHQHATTRPVINSIYDIVLNCLEGGRSAGVKRLVLASSIVVYGGELAPLTEDRALAPQISIQDERAPIRVARFEIRVKRIVEQLVLEYGVPLDAATSATERLKPQREMETVALRLPGQFGPGYSYMGNPFGLAVHAAAGRLDGLRDRVGYMNIPVPQLWNTFGVTSPLYVKDTASAIRAAIEAPSLPRSIYNVTSGFTNNPRKQLQALLKVAPDSAARLGLAPDDLADAELDVGFNADLIRRELGWRSAFTLEDAYMDYLNWLKANRY